MKNMFKLAAVAVSMALAMGLVACSDSVDDVVDESTVKSFWSSKISKYVDSLEYEQNVKDEEIESLKKAHENMMVVVGDCEECLEAYFEVVETNTGLDKLTSKNIKDVEEQLKYLKGNSKYNTEKEFHKRLVYKPDIEDAIDDLQEAKKEVDAIADINKDKLNDRQSASMSAYFDAVAALKAALNEDDAKKCKTTIDAADNAIEAFNKLPKVNKDNITGVITKVDAMVTDIKTNVVDKITL